MGCSPGKSSALARTAGRPCKPTGNANGTLLTTSGAGKSPKGLHQAFHRDMALLELKTAEEPVFSFGELPEEALPEALTGFIANASKNPNLQSPVLTGQPTSRVHKNPQGWEEEGILFPHEGIRFLLHELSVAVRTMDPLVVWKWENLAVWYQEYFYDVVHHHHDTEEKIYLPWIQTRVQVPAKITNDHPELMQAMDSLRDMLKAGASLPVSQRAQHLSQVQKLVLTFIDDMQEHLAEEEEVIPHLLREAGFTQAEEGAVVEKIIQSLGLDGNKKALPTMLHALALWAGPDKAEEFVSGNLPLPIQAFYKIVWLPDFQHRHMGLLASLAEGVDSNPFASQWFCR